MTYNRSDGNCWIINKHINDFNLIFDYLIHLKKNQALNNSEVTKSVKELFLNNTYRPRYGKLKLSTFKNKVSELGFYMLGFENNKKFYISPLGDLLIKHQEDEAKVSLIFSSLLWGLQFNHPKNKTPDNFNLYPIRLFYRLLQDKRLDFHLETIEVLYFLYFVEEIDLEKYEKLVHGILEFRNLNNAEKLELLFSHNIGRQHNVNVSNFEIANNIFWANKLHEWDYYFIKVLKGAGVVEVNEGQSIYKFQHYLPGKTPTFRTLKSNKYRIPKSINNFLLNLQKEFPFNDIPCSKEYMTSEEYLLTVYSFLPNNLLIALDEKGVEYSLFEELNSSSETLLKGEDIIIIPDEIIINSSTSEKFNEFELILQKSFNYFSDVNAKRISGAGNTDIECLYLIDRQKFNVEAKTRRDQLTEVSISRLDKHRKKNGSVFTVIITSKYSIGAKRDISGTNNVLLNSKVFSNYMFNLMNCENKSFADFNKIILENLGNSISSNLANYTLDTFGIKGY